MTSGTRKSGKEALHSCLHAPDGRCPRTFHPIRKVRMFICAHITLVTGQDLTVTVPVAV
jgi:hypothetical protein